ncbi:hypothetical protein EDD90_8870 [Streptomyces sp. Ag109_O5-1]|uniref:hypothetical protein n=1 Tax=Streptomyces TaxID=1883 RepID=UPI000FBC6189|nr:MULTISPECIES: hypothetical protein [Streptomyces]RPE45583.1 hypothetical protein EDD90_8870 [Streptomyces sp. Ag109_O5-1]
MQAVLPAHTIEVGTEPLDRPTRNSVGGRPFLDDAGEPDHCDPAAVWPVNQN